MRYFRNTSWLFAEKILRIIVGLFVGIWVARYLGPEQYGLFSYAQSFVGLFVVIATLGLDSIVVRELVKDEGKRDLLLGTAFTLKLIGSFVVLLLLVIAVNYTSNTFSTNVLILIIGSATIFQSFNVVDMYFQSKVLSKYVVYANVISLFFSSITKIALILNGYSLIAFAWVVLFDSLVLALSFICFYVKHKNLTLNTEHLTLISWKFNQVTAIKLLKDSWLLVLSGVVVSIYMKIDQVMIKEMLGSEAVGQYAAAATLSEAWYFIPMIITSSLFPAIINAKKKSEELYYARLQNLYDIMVWMAIAIAVPMTFMSAWIVEMLYGEQYNQAGSVLVIHIWATIFVFLGVASGKWLVIENLQILSFLRTFYGMVINVLLNIFLIPRYGIQGAAIATLISYFLAGLLFDLFNKKTKKVFLMKLNTINLKRII